MTRWFIGVFCAVGLLLCGLAMAALAQQYVTPPTPIGGPVIPILNNSSVTANGSLTVSNLGFSKYNLLIDVTGTVTGTNPTLAFTIAEQDPLKTGTALGKSITGANITAAGTQNLTISGIRSATLKISWTIGGTSTPTFPGTYVTLVGRASGSQEDYATFSTTKTCVDNATAYSVPDAGNLGGRTSMTITNMNTNVIYCSEGTPTVGNGQPLSQYQSAVWAVGSATTISCIAATADQTGNNCTMATEAAP